MVPEKLRKRVLEYLRTGHMDMNKMKPVARSFVWCPLIDDDEIEQLAKSCGPCLIIHLLASLSFASLSLANLSWRQQMHVDFAGPHSRQFVLDNM